MSRVSLIIGGVTADLYKGEDITLVKQAKDLTDLGATRTDFSRPFTIPATDTNNGIFTHFYNLDIDDPYPVHNKAEASINVKGVQIFEGVLELMNVTLKNNIPDSYEVNFYGRNKQLTTLWGDDYLRDINMNLDHALTYTNVVASWGGTLQSGQIRYPVIDFGSREQGAWNYSTAGMAQNSIAIDGGAIHPAELRPAVRLSTILTKCFTHISKTLTLDSSIDDDNLYMMGMEKVGKFLDGYDAEVNAELVVDVSAGTSYNDLAGFTENTDNDIRFNDTTGEFTAATVGNYTFRLAFTSITSSRSFNIRARKNGNVMPNAPVQSSGTSQTYTFTMFLQQGDVIKFQVAETQGLAFTATLVYDLIDWPTFKTGATILIEDGMPEVKITDFINGVLKMFNAVLTTSDGVAYTMSPLTDYLNAGATKEWSDKIDTSVIKIDKQEVPESVKLKHKESEDLANISFKNAFARDYGAVKYENAGLFDFTSDSIEVESPFVIMPTTLENQVDTAGVRIGTTDLEIYKFMDTDGEPIQVELSLFYWAGYETTAFTWKMVNDSAVVVDQTSFPYFRTWDDKPVASTDNSIAFSIETPPSRAITTNTFLEKYWRPHLDRIFNPAMRRVQMTAYLDTTDWLTLEMNDTIQIATRPYKIEKISYNMTEGRATLDLFTYDQKATATPTYSDDGTLTWDQTPTNQELKLAGALKVGSNYLIKPDELYQSRSRGIAQQGAIQHLTFLANPRVLDMIINTDEAISMTTSYQEIGGYDTSTFDQCTCFTKNLTTGEFTQNDNFITEVIFHASFTNETTKDIQFAILVNGVETNFVAFEPNGSSEVMLVGLMNLFNEDTISIGIKKVASGNATLTISDASFIVKRA
jgi:hypothetical protein